MRTLSERLLEAMRVAGKNNQSELARECGVTRAAVSKWIASSSAKMHADHVFRVARYLGVDGEWLATGRGQMAPSTTAASPADSALLDATRQDDPTFASFLQDYRALSSVEKTIVRTVVVALARSHDPIYLAYEKDQRARNDKRDAKTAKAKG